MKVILLKSVPKLGRAEQVVEVPDGYAQNALFPKKLAVQATQKAIDALKTKQGNAATKIQIQHDLLDRAINALEGRTLNYAAKANDKGVLFSKIDLKDISDALLKEQRISIDPKKMRVVEGQIKQLGTYTVEVVDGTYKSSFILEIINYK